MNRAESVTQPDNQEAAVDPEHVTEVGLDDEAGLSLVFRVKHQLPLRLQASYQSRRDAGKLSCIGMQQAVARSTRFPYTALEKLARQSV
jgi:hypothetical protein